MTENKDNIKKQYREILETDIDNLFSQDIPASEIDGIVVKEVGDILKEVTVLNNIISESQEDDIQAMKQLNEAERGVSDLRKIAKIKEDLAKAA